MQSDTLLEVKSGDRDANSDYGSTSDSLSSVESVQDLEKNFEVRWGTLDRRYEFLRTLADFLVSCTSIPQLIMWGFLAWFLLVVFLSLPLNPKPFKDALVIMSLIGLVLNANAFVAYQHHIHSCPVSTFEPTLGVFLRRQSASIARLFVIPYCVSCYSGIANSTPGFVSIFPTDPAILIPVVIGAVSFPLSLRLVSNILSHIVYPDETGSHLNERRRSSISEIKF